MNISPSPPLLGEAGRGLKLTTIMKKTYQNPQSEVVKTMAGLRLMDGPEFRASGSEESGIGHAPGRIPKSI